MVPYMAADYFGCKFDFSNINLRSFFNVRINSNHPVLLLKDESWCAKDAQSSFM